MWRRGDGVRDGRCLSGRCLSAETDASVIGINDRGGIILDRTIFYATSGGQPGDTGRLVRADGSAIAIAATITGESKDEIIHIPAAGQASLQLGEAVRLAIDWERRLKLMRMHTACHLLSVVCPFPITGAAVSEDDCRVDFDIPRSRLYQGGSDGEADGSGAGRTTLCSSAGSLTTDCRQSRSGEVEECASAVGDRPHPAGLHRRECIGRQPALRRHACCGDGGGR